MKGDPQPRKRPSRSALHDDAYMPEQAVAVDAPDTPLIIVERRERVGEVFAGDGEYASPVHAAFAIAADAMPEHPKESANFEFTYGGNTYTVTREPS